MPCLTTSWGRTGHTTRSKPRSRSTNCMRTGWHVGLTSGSVRCSWRTRVAGAHLWLAPRVAAGRVAEVVHQQRGLHMSQQGVQRRARARAHLPGHRGHRVGGQRSPLVPIFTLQIW
jgi:hypothetical protein